jgi:hypothetical protein
MRRKRCWQAKHNEHAMYEREGGVEYINRKLGAIIMSLCGVVKPVFKCKADGFYRTQILASVPNPVLVSKELSESAVVQFSII